MSGKRTKQNDKIEKTNEKKNPKTKPEEEPRIDKKDQEEDPNETKPQIDILAEPKSQRKREFIRDYERKIQQYWSDNSVFEADAEEGKQTWMGTFPYPYMNGRLHLGHAFTTSKVDFSAGYHRLKGKKSSLSVCISLHWDADQGLC